MKRAAGMICLTYLQLVAAGDIRFSKAKGVPTAASVRNFNARNCLADFFPCWKRNQLLRKAAVFMPSTYAGALGRFFRSGGELRRCRASVFGPGGSGVAAGGV
jgi:hypothetical protein